MRCQYRLPRTDQDHVFEFGVVAGPDRSPLRLGHRPIERPLLDLFQFIFSLAVGVFFFIELFAFEPLLQSIVVVIAVRKQRKSMSTAASLSMSTYDYGASSTAGLSSTTLRASSGSVVVGTNAAIKAVSGSTFAAGGFFATFFGAAFFDVGAVAATLLLGRFTRLAGTTGLTASGSAGPAGAAGTTCCPSRFRFPAAAVRGAATTVPSVVAIEAVLDPDAVAAAAPHGAAWSGSGGGAIASMSG
jgi:hypothetical protein